jgi:dUTPase
MKSKYRAPLIPTFYFAVTECVDKACEDYNSIPMSKRSSDIKSESFIPSRSEPEAACWDVRCAEPDGIALAPEKYIKIPLGFRVFSPQGWWLELRPRSGTLIKKHIHSLYGVIDTNFEGQCFFCGQYMPDADINLNRNNFKKICFGERIAQIRPVKLYNMVCKKISNERYDAMGFARNGERGTSGFGGSGDL